MCEFKKLIDTATGYISQCSFCRSIEIVYGNSVIHIGFSDWQSFMAYLRSVQQSCRKTENKTTKTIMLHFGGNGPLQMFLSFEELNQFCELTDLADSEINALQLMDLFNAG